MLRTRLLPLLALLCLPAAVAGCGGSSGTDTQGSKIADVPPVHTVKVVYAAPEGADAKLAKLVLTSGGTTGVAKGLVNDFKLPWDVKVLVRNTSTTGPQYQPADHSINLDYAFAAFVLKQVKAQHPDITDYHLGEQAAAINTFIFVHEFAHLLIDAYDLPITGREEDAADQLATVFMTQFVKHGDEYAFDAAEFFDSLAKNPSKLESSDFFDEHSLDQQRAYAIVCWIAGSSDKDYEAIKQAKIFPNSRLEQCPAEYQQKVHAWLTLIRPHLNQTGKDQARTTDNG
jgi:hypothetical protein